MLLKGELQDLAGLCGHMKYSRKADFSDLKALGMERVVGGAVSAGGPGPLGGKAGRRRLRSAAFPAVREGREESFAFHCCLLGDLWCLRCPARCCGG